MKGYRDGMEEYMISYCVEEGKGTGMGEAKWGVSMSNIMERRVGLW